MAESGGSSRREGLETYLPVHALDSGGTPRVGLVLFRLRQRGLQKAKRSRKKFLQRGVELMCGIDYPKEQVDQQNLFEMGGAGLRGPEGPRVATGVDETTSRHTCHAIGCEVPIIPRLLMCKPHWSKVPSKLRRAVWDHYLPGQEIRKKPTKEYLDAANAAIKAVAEEEGVLVPVPAPRSTET